jgi:pimeloyl-ACP methyl ester carboxylesterase
VLALPPPYIVVGHSLGGFYAQVFVRRHPDDVAAVVLVDAASQFEPPGVFVTRSRLEPGSIPALEEEGFGPGIAALEAGPPFPPVPLIVLAATDHAMSSSLEEQWQRTQAKIPGLSPKGRLEVVAGSGHYIQTDRPEAVVAAIEDAARAGGLSAGRCGP